MATPKLHFHSLVGSQLPRLRLFTTSGQLREAPLTRQDLVRIIQSAASALEALDREEASH